VVVLLCSFILNFRFLQISIQNKLFQLLKAIHIETDTTDGNTITFIGQRQDKKFQSLYTSSGNTVQLE